MRSPTRQLILGVDEAGYGPNIGPLVIACSAWLVVEPLEKASDLKPAAESMLDRLAPVFLPKPAVSTARHIPLGDSKMLYASGGSIDSLALGVRHWMRTIEIEAKSFQRVLKELAPEFVALMPEFLWYQPVEDTMSQTEHFASLNERLPDSLLDSADEACRRAGLQFLGLAAAIVDERRFNRDVERLGNKASLLSQISLELAVNCLNRQIAEGTVKFDSIHIYCDKHGGRNRYQAMLMHAMPDLWFDVIRETAARSDYRSRYQDCDLQWSFLAKGDRLMASALASMTAKWLREGLMARLNRFWQSHLPDLRPTAGYPVDAKRFRAAIQPIADRMQFPTTDWWRSR